MSISAGQGIAVREFPLQSGFADYLLYADCKALGVIEAIERAFSYDDQGNRKPRR
jgi:type I restriction enzyme R subunit